MVQLLWLFIIPFISSLICFCFQFLSKKHLKNLAVFLSLIPLVILLSKSFNQWIGENVQYQWLPFLSIDFHLALDSLSLLFIYLTAVIVPLALMIVRSDSLIHPNFFYGLVLLLQGLLIGFFSSRDLALFTIFWEAMLFPLYFLITIWGGSERKRAALKFIIYMIAGSALMIAAVLGVYLINGAHSFNLDLLQKGMSGGGPFVFWIFAIFALAFAVKTPLFPFHGWLPDAYYQASTTGTILLSALLSKAGIYGFLRIGLGLFPDLMKEWSVFFLGFAIAGTLYAALAAWMQNDYKKLIAYSSLSHVNFILAGVFAWSQTAHEGAVLQALNHGVTITALFMAAWWLEERIKTTSLKPFSGLTKYFPHLCWLTLFFVLSSVALPGTNNFVGEFLILFGLFKLHPWLTFILGLSIILSVAYMLRWMQSQYFNPYHPLEYKTADIGFKEFAIALPLIFLILWIGIYPTPLLKQIEKAPVILQEEKS